MIKSKQDLVDYMAEDNRWYHPKSFRESFLDWIKFSPYRRIKKYLIYLRKFEYHLNNSKGSRYHTYLSWIYEGKKNRLGERIGIEIGPNCFERGLSIWHPGIVVNPDARIGKNCTLHGCNCIGNNGSVNNNPQIGDDVDIGFGAVIIGKVHLADGIIIGANSVVNKNFETDGSVIVGAPARQVK